MNTEQNIRCLSRSSEW